VHPGASVSFGHIQRRLPEAPVRSGVISRTGNGKGGRGILNLTWEECVKIYLKDWSITKELALDRREGKLAIHVPESWSLVPPLYCLFILVFFLFIHPFSPFIVFQFFNCLPPPLLFVFYCPSFFTFGLCLFFRLLWVSSLAYANLLGTKRLGCCRCWCKYFLLVIKSAPVSFISSLPQLAWD
jgi:hypothetical protein